MIARHYPEILEEKDRYRQFFSSVATRQARLVAKWMQLGFQDYSLLGELLALMENQKADFTLTFRYLADHTRQESNMTPQFRKLFKAPDTVAAWLKTWQQRLATVNRPEIIQAEMNRVNPLFIPRNHRIHKAIEEAEARDDFSQVHLLAMLYENPFTEQPEFTDYAQAPAIEERVTRTFCGT